MPNIDTSKVCFLIVKAREFDAREDAVEEDYGGNPIDEGFREILADPSDPAYAEIREQIEDMNVDEQCELVALAWIGRGDFTADEWTEALRLARERHNEHTANYLLGMPLLGDYLDEGLAGFDIRCTD
jgi:hypothetical protein